MSRINDLPGPIAAQSGDTVVGTDKTDSNKTVKFTVDSIAALATGSSVALLDDIGNVNTSSKSDGQVLSWNESEGEWRATTVSGSGATALPDLTDVANDATSSASPGDVLAWDTSSGGEWQSQATSLVIAPETLNGLDDVNLSVVSGGEFLQYNSTAGKWENSTLDLSKLDDVDTSGVAKGDILVYDGAGEFTPTRQKVNLNASLVGVFDISLNTPYTGGLAVTGGTVLRNVAFIIPSDLDNWRIEEFKISVYQTNVTSSSEVALTLANNNTIIDSTVSTTFTGDSASPAALVKQTATYSSFPTVSEDDTIGIAILSSPAPTNLTEFYQAVISIKLIPPV